MSINALRHPQRHYGIIVNKKLILREAVTVDGVAKPEQIAIGYGKLIEVSVDFCIIGFVVFLVVKIMNTIRKKVDDPKNATEETPKNIELLHKMTELMEIQVKQLEELKQK